MRERRSAELALLVTVVIWSLNFVAVKTGVTYIPPLAFSVTRFFVGATVTLIVALRLEGRPHFRRADLPLLVLAAVVGISINQAAFVGALRQTTASNTALLIGTIPVWTSVLAVLTRQEKLALHHWIGVGIGLLGVALIVLGGSNADGDSPTFLGEVLALTTAASWAIYSVIIRPLMARYTALSLSSFMMVVGTVALLPFALPDLATTNWSAIPAQAWLGLLYAALFSVSLTNILYFTAIGRVGASRAALFTYLEPFLGVLFATLLLSEHATTIQLAGGVGVVAAILVARPRRRTIAEPGI
ncbi:MAG: DMT family transporter [Candidatus Limnocylindrales bacterium]